MERNLGVNKGIIDPMSDKPHDPVNHPSHYNDHPSGVETKEVTKHFSAMLGFAVKYVWRAGKKGDRAEDLRKAAWCFRAEADRLEEDPNAPVFLSRAWKKNAAKVVLAQPPPHLLAQVLVKLLGSVGSTHPSYLDLREDLREIATMCEDEASRS